MTPRIGLGNWGHVTDWERKDYIGKRKPKDGVQGPQRKGTASKSRSPHE